MAKYFHCTTIFINNIQINLIIFFLKQLYFLVKSIMVVDRDIDSNEMKSESKNSYILMNELAT